MSVSLWRARFSLVCLSLLSVLFLGSPEVYAQVKQVLVLGGTPQCPEPVWETESPRPSGEFYSFELFLRCTQVGIAGGVTSTSGGSGSIGSFDIFFPDSARQQPQSYSGVRGTVGVLATTNLPIFAPHPSSMPDALLLIDEPTPFVTTGFLGNFGSDHSSSFNALGVTDATGTTTVKTQSSVPLFLGVQFPAPLFGPGGAFEVFGGGMIDWRKMDFATSEHGTPIVTTASTSKTQLNPALGAGISVALLPDLSSLEPPRVIRLTNVRAKFSLQYIADFQRSMNQDVRSFAFDSIFFSQHSGNLVNSIVLATVSFPLDELIGPPPPLPVSR